MISSVLRFRMPPGAQKQVQVFVLSRKKTHDRPNTRRYCTPSYSWIYKPQATWYSVPFKQDCVLTTRKESKQTGMNHHHTHRLPLCRFSTRSQTQSFFALAGIESARSVSPGSLSKTGKNLRGSGTPTPTGCLTLTRIRVPRAPDSCVGSTCPACCYAISTPIPVCCLSRHRMVRCHP
jgi:hypothetical protein